jgi:hypothetical protein
MRHAQKGWHTLQCRTFGSQKIHWRISVLEVAKFYIYIPKVLCTCRFYAKGIDINIVKIKLNNNDNNDKSGE